MSFIANFISVILESIFFVSQCIKEVLEEIITIFLGIIVLVLNLLVVFYGVYHRKIRKEIVGTIFLCVADSIFQLAYTMAFTRKVFVFIFYDTTERVSNWECFKHGYPLLLQFAYPHTGFADFLFSAEKMFMIMAPIYYSRLRMKHICWAFLVGTTIIFCRTVYVGVAWSQTEPYSVGILCDSENIPMQFQGPSVLARLILVAASVLVFLPVLLKIHELKRSVRSSNMQRSEYDSRTVKTALHAGLLILVVLLFIVIPDLIRIFFNDFFLIYQNLFFNLGIAKPIANTLFAISIFKGFRNGNRVNGRASKHTASGGGHKQTGITTVEK